MANLIKIYYTKKKIPTHIEFVPGDVVIFGKIQNIIFIGSESVEELYVVNLYRDPKFITKKCLICNRFHINRTQYINYLGNHWEKYKDRFFKLGLPITGNDCYQYR